MTEKKLSTEEYLNQQKIQLRESYEKEIIRLKKVIEFKKEKIEFLSQDDITLDDYVHKYKGREI